MIKPESDTNPDAGVGRSSSPPSLGSILRIPLRCGGKNGRCAAPVLVSIDAFANPANLRTVLETAGWGLITHGMVHQGKPIPLIDPACPECHAEYEEQQAELAAQKAAADAAAEALTNAADDDGADPGTASALVPDAAPDPAESEATPPTA